MHYTINTLFTDRYVSKLQEVKREFSCENIKIPLKLLHYEIIFTFILA